MLLLLFDGCLEQRSWLIKNNTLRRKNIIKIKGVGERDLTAANANLLAKRERKKR